MSAKAKRVTVSIVLIIVVDQLTKWLVDRMMPLHHSIPIIDGFFNLTYIRNTGAAFGILAGSAEAFRLPLLLAFSVLAVVFILMMLRRLPPTETGLITALALILGGALGNLIDRVVHGEVIDFFDFYLGRYHWPAFNVADSCITIGVAVTIYYMVTAESDPFAKNPSSV